MVRQNFLQKTINGIGNFIRAKSFDGFLWDSTMPSGKWNGKDFLKVNEISLYVNRAIEKRAEKVGQTQFVLFDGDKQIENNWVLDLLAKPNRFHTGDAFFRLYQKYKDLTGKAFIFKEYNSEIFKKEKRVTALHLLRPDLVEIKYNDNKTEIEKFVYKTGSKNIEYTPDQIIYSFNPDPLSPTEGVSLLKAGVTAIETEIQIREYHANILKNGGKIEGVFKFKTPRITKEQLEELKQSYQEQYAGAKKAGLPMFIGGDTEYQRMGLTPDELSYLEAKAMSLEDICILTGVPKVLLASFQDIKFDNANAAEAIFQRETIKPLVEDLCAVLDEDLVPGEVDLTYIDQTPQDVAQKLSILEIADKTHSLTPNERREILSDLFEGIGAYSDKAADKIYQPFNLMPIGEDEGDKSKIYKAEGFKHPLRDEKVRKVYSEEHIKKSDAEERVFKKGIRSFFKGQRERILEKIGDQKMAKGMKKKNLLGEVFDQELEVKLLEDTALPLIKDLFIRTGNEAMILVGAKYSFDYGSHAQSWVSDRAGFLGKEINDTTLNDLGKLISDTVDQGMGRKELIEGLDSIYDGYSKERLNLIARTEVHGAINSAKMEGYKQADVPIKIWVHAGFGDARDWHLAIDGEERPLNQPFSIGLMYPGDGGPEDSANCQCTI